MPYTWIFEDIVGAHIEIEGGLVNDPLDPGGMTKYGISKRFNPDVDVENLTIEQAKAFYHERYWRPMRLDEIHKAPIARELFDIGGGPNGIRAAVLIAQGALVLLREDVAIDGIMGPKTIRALNTYPWTGDLVKMMNLLQFVHLLVGSANVENTIEMVRDRLPQLKRFMRGWLKRIAF
jgi:lysozyme family protein